MSSGNISSNSRKKSHTFIDPSHAQPIAVATIMTIRYYIVSLFWLFITRAGAHYIIRKRCLYEEKMKQYEKELEELDTIKKASNERVDTLRNFVEGATSVNMGETFKLVKSSINKLIDLLNYVAPSTKSEPDPQIPKPIKPMEDMFEKIINFVVTDKTNNMCLVLRDIVEGIMGNIILGVMAVGGWQYMIKPWKLWKLIYHDVLYWQSHDKPLFEYVVNNLIYHPLPNSTKEVENVEMMEKLRKENKKLTKTIVSGLDKSDQKKLATTIKKVSKKNAKNFLKNNTKALHMMNKAERAAR